MRGLVGEQNAQVAKIISCGSGDDGVAKGFEKWIGVERSERAAHFVYTVAFGLHSVASSVANSIGYSIQGAAIDDGSCSRAVAVDAVGAGAENGYIVSRY